MSSLRSKIRGVSLVEAVLSTFLLLTALLLAVYVFDSSLKWEVSNEKRVVAALVAESALAQIREQGGRNFENVFTYDGRNNWTVPDYPDFRIDSVVKKKRLATACTELESQYKAAAKFPEPTGKFLEDSGVKATVKVSWTDPVPQSIEVSEQIVSLREVENFRLSVTSDGGSTGGLMVVRKDGTLNFNVEAMANGRPVTDLQYTWFVEPLSGFGSVDRVSRDGYECRYINAYQNYKNQRQYAFGHCYLSVQAVYQGKTAKTRIRINNVE